VVQICNWPIILRVTLFEKRNYFAHFSLQEVFPSAAHFWVLWIVSLLNEGLFFGSDWLLNFSTLLWKAFSNWPAHF
jgi:hypothetical protein